MGEEVAEYNGAYKASKGNAGWIWTGHASLDTPISELGFAGIGVGSAMNGNRPIIEFMTFNFSLVGIDQIINNAAKITANVGRAIQLPDRISRDLRLRPVNWLQRTPRRSKAGMPTARALKVVVPSNPADAKGLLKSSIRDNDPVIFMESEQMYGDKGEVPEGDYTIPLGVADITKGRLRCNHCFLR